MGSAVQIQVYKACKDLPKTIQCSKGCQRGFKKHWTEGQNTFINKLSIFDLNKFATKI